MRNPQRRRYSIGRLTREATTGCSHPPCPTCSDTPADVRVQRADRGRDVYPPNLRPRTDMHDWAALEKSTSLCSADARFCALCRPCARLAPEPSGTSVCLLPGWADDADQMVQSTRTQSRKRGLLGRWLLHAPRGSVSVFILLKELSILGRQLEPPSLLLLNPAQNHLPESFFATDSPQFLIRKAYL